MSILVNIIVVLLIVEVVLIFLRDEPTIFSFKRLGKQFVVCGDKQEVFAALEKSMSMVLMKYKKDDDDEYEIQLKDAKVEIEVSSRGLFTLISYEEDWPLKKRNLLLQLVAKQFHGVLPTIVINLRKK